MKGAVKPLEVRSGTGVRCIKCGGENDQGNHILHRDACVCPYCGDTGPGVMWHLPQCQRSNYNNHFGERMWSWGSGAPDDGAGEYWIIRAYMQGFSKIGIARTLGYRSVFMVNAVLDLFQIR
jgi:hypothetical protein